MWKNIFFHDCGIWGVGEAWLLVCGILVLTHNFEVWRPVVARLLVFSICGLWFQRRQWQNCKSKQAGGSFDSKPILLWFATRCRGNKKFIFCPILSKLKLGLELKQKFVAKSLFGTISTQFIWSVWLHLFVDQNNRGVGKARLPVCRVLVLTHNFEMRWPEKARLPVFTICGLRLQICLWQNCKSKQASGCGFCDASGKIVSQNKHRVVVSLMPVAKL